MGHDLPLVISPLSRVNVSIVHLGCPKNQTLSEYLAGMVHACGARLCDLDEAEAVIVNTCGFITPAREESIDRILEAGLGKRESRVKRIIVTGCMSELYGEELKAEIPEIDAIVPIDEVDKIPALIGLDAPARPVRRLLETNAYAYLKIAEGCDHTCAFCLIPTLTGSFRSRSVAALLQEARYLEGEGVTELLLVAQDTTQYGGDLTPPVPLRELLERLLAETSFPWIRVMYLYPETFDFSLLDLMQREERLVPYLDIPLQHADPAVLRAMGRGGSAEHFKRLIGKIREKVPNVTLRTTFIVGHPGEGEREFSTLCSFMEEMRFDHVGFFPYDDDPILASHALPDHPVVEVVEERIERLVALQEAISLEHHAGLMGREMELLVDQVTSEGVTARHRGMAPEIDGEVNLPRDDTIIPGDLVTGRIVKVYPFSLEAEWA